MQHVNENWGKPWKFVCDEFSAVRKELRKDDPDHIKIMKTVEKICDDYAKKKWDCAQHFEQLRDEIHDDLEIEDMDMANADFYLNEFYDLCDNTRVFLATI